MSQSIVALEQRKEQASKNIAEVKTLQAEYLQSLRRAQALLVTNGLGQTLAFLKAKSSKATNNFLLKHVSEWILLLHDAGVERGESNISPKPEPEAASGGAEKQEKLDGEDAKQDEPKDTAEKAQKPKRRGDLLNLILKRDSAFLRWATQESLTFLSCLLECAEEQQANQTTSESA